MPISRRDFLNGISLAIVTGSLPLNDARAKFLVENEYPPRLTGLRGSHPGSFENAHLLARENKVFSVDSLDIEEFYDLVVVGGGISGLSAAYYYRKKNPKARILILENHDDFGGHAKRNEFHINNKMILGYGGVESLDAPHSRFSQTSIQLLKEIGIDIDLLGKHFDRDFYYNQGLSRGVFFNKENFGQDKLVTGNPFPNPNNDPYPTNRLNGKSIQNFINDFPISEKDKKNLILLYTGNLNYLENKTKEDHASYLSKISYRDYLLKDVGLSENAVNYFQAYTHDSLAIGIDAVSAFEVKEDFFSPGFSGLKFPQENDNNEKERDEAYIYHFPDGNASIARLLVSHLIPESSGGKKDMNNIVLTQFDYSKLDRKKNLVRIRLNSTVVLAKNTKNNSVDIGYLDKPIIKSDGTLIQTGKLHRVNAKHVVMSNYNMMIPSIVNDLPENQKKALHANVKAPIVFSKVLISNWKSFIQLGVHEIYSPLMPYSTVKLDYPVNIGGYKFPKDPASPVALQMLSMPVSPNQGLDARNQFRIGRYKLLTKPFSAFEEEIRDQLQRLLGPGGFHHEKDIKEITVNRWSHGFSYSPSSLYDDPIETEEFKKIACKPLGNIVIANSDAAWDAYTNAAIDMAYRAVQELKF